MLFAYLLGKGGQAYSSIMMALTLCIIGMGAWAALLRGSSPGYLSFGWLGALIVTFILDMCTGTRFLRAVQGQQQQQQQQASDPTTTSPDQFEPLANPTPLYHIQKGPGSAMQDVRPSRADALAYHTAARAPGDTTPAAPATAPGATSTTERRSQVLAEALPNLEHQQFPVVPNTATIASPSNGNSARLDHLLRPTPQSVPLQATPHNLIIDGSDWAWTNTPSNEDPDLAAGAKPGKPNYLLADCPAAAAAGARTGLAAAQVLSDCTRGEQLETQNGGGTGSRGADEGVGLADPAGALPAGQPADAVVAAATVPAAAAAAQPGAGLYRSPLGPSQKLCIKICTWHTPQHLRPDAIQRLEQVIVRTAAVSGAPSTPALIGATVSSGCICIVLNTVGLEAEGAEQLLQGLVPELMAALGLDPGQQPGAGAAAGGAAGGVEGAEGAAAGGPEGVPAAALQPGQSITLQLGDQLVVATWDAVAGSWTLDTRAVPWDEEGGVQGLTDGTGSGSGRVDMDSALGPAAVGSAVGSVGGPRMRPRLGLVRPCLLVLQEDGSVSSSGTVSYTAAVEPTASSTVGQLEFYVSVHSLPRGCVVTGWQRPDQAHSLPAAVGSYTLKLAVSGQVVPTEVQVLETEEHGMETNVKVVCSYTELRTTLLAASPASTTIPAYHSGMHLALSGLQLELWQGDLLVDDSPALLAWSTTNHQLSTAEDHQAGDLAQEVTQLQQAMSPEPFALFIQELGAWLHMAGLAVGGRTTAVAGLVPTTQTTAKLLIWGEALHQACACGLPALAGHVQLQLLRLEHLCSSSAATSAGRTAGVAGEHLMMPDGDTDPWLEPPSYGHPDASNASLWSSKPANTISQSLGRLSDYRNDNHPTDSNYHPTDSFSSRPLPNNPPPASTAATDGLALLGSSRQQQPVGQQHPSRSLSGPFSSSLLAADPTAAVGSPAGLRHRRPPRSIGVGGAGNEDNPTPAPAATPAGVPPAAQAAALPPFGLWLAQRARQWAQGVQQQLLGAPRAAATVPASRPDGPAAAVPATTGLPVRQVDGLPARRMARSAAAALAADSPARVGGGARQVASSAAAHRSVVSRAWAGPCMTSSGSIHAYANPPEVALHVERVVAAGADAANLLLQPRPRLLLSLLRAYTLGWASPHLAAGFQLHQGRGGVVRVGLWVATHLLLILQAFVHDVREGTPWTQWLPPTLINVIPSVALLVLYCLCIRQPVGYIADNQAVETVDSVGSAVKKDSPGMVMAWRWRMVMPLCNVLAIAQQLSVLLHRFGWAGGPMVPVMLLLYRTGADVPAFTVMQVAYEQVSFWALLLKHAIWIATWPQVLSGLAHIPYADAQGHMALLVGTSFCGSILLQMGNQLAFLRSAVAAGARAHAAGLGGGSGKAVRVRGPQSCGLLGEGVGREWGEGW